MADSCRNEIKDGENMNGYLAAGIFLIAIVAFVWMLRLENRRFKVTEYIVRTDKITEDVTLAVMSDLHNYSYGTGNEKLLKKLREIHPDAVISAGDMIEGSPNAKGTGETIRFLSKVSEEFPFYYGLGNHESKFLRDPGKYEKTEQEFFSAVNQTKLELLDNKTRMLSCGNIKITGLELERTYFRKVKRNPVSAEHITKLVGESDSSCFHILIAHNPDQFDAYVKWGADLVLSGHVHGGMIVIPGIGGVISPQLTLFPKYDGGEYRKGKTTMLLSRGLGNHTVHVRIFNRAELLVVRLLRK